MTNNENSGTPPNRQRRKVLAGLAASAGVVGFGGAAPDSIFSDGFERPLLPSPEASGIDHIVVLMMENRSFDHYLGWVPGANGRQSGLRFVDGVGVTYATRDLAPNYQNCTSADPDHSFAGGRIHYNNGSLDGFLQTQPVGDQFPIGYYTAESLPFFKGVVENWTICDRYHSGLLGPTWPNRLYMHGGQTDRLSNSLTPVWTKPTVWDRLRGVGRTGRYYYGDLAGWALVSFLLAGHNPGLPNIRPFDDFLDDAASGDLADVTFIDPSMLGEGAGTSNDDHPMADIRSGQVLLNTVYDALRNGPKWGTTLFVVNYDEWGGFFDHVVPPFAPMTDEERAAGNDGLLGFRVPCVAMGPRVRRGHIETRQLDPNSILNMIAWRFGFDALGARGTSSLNFAYTLDFGSEPDPSAPAFDVPHDPSYGQACASQLEAARSAMAPDRYAEVVARQDEHSAEWRRLVDAALRSGLKPPR